VHVRTLLELTSTVYPSGQVHPGCSRTLFAGFVSEDSMYEVQDVSGELVHGRSHSTIIVLHALLVVVESGA
jgi:hypothetical protein